MVSKPAVPNRLKCTFFDTNCIARNRVLIVTQEQGYNAPHMIANARSSEVDIIGTTERITLKTMSLKSLTKMFATTTLSSCKLHYAGFNAPIDNVQKQ
jgi:hypothetical protein